MAMDVNPYYPLAPGIMFSVSILFGNHVPLISLGAIISAVEVRDHPHTRSIGQFTNRVRLGSAKKEIKNTVAAPHNSTRLRHDYSSIITRHAAEPWHG